MQTISEKWQNLIDTPSKTIGGVSKHREFLREHKEEIANAFNNGVSFNRIAKFLAKEYNLKITYAVVRSFGESELGLKVASRPKRTKS